MRCLKTRRLTLILIPIETPILATVQHPKIHMEQHKTLITRHRRRHRILTIRSNVLIAYRMAMEANSRARMECHLLHRAVIKAHNNNPINTARHRREHMRINNSMPMGCHHQDMERRLRVRFH